MTKTKSQLRAEAVERLRKLNCMDVDCYQLLEATVDDAGEKVGYRVEIRKLIDLLTDDANEARGSYEERLYDVPVSDCPYCGCERVVIHDFSDIYEKPHSYRVEHMDEKEAFEAGCFETYYAFDSVEKAVEHANMRDTLTDEPMDARRDNNGTCPIDDGTVPNHSKNAPTLSDLYGILGGENSENLGQSQNSEVDSREKLEADVRQYANPEGNTGTLGACWERKMIEFLDRQAAITRAECDKPNWDYCETCEQLKAMQDRIDELEAALKGERNNFYQAMESRKHWQREYENLKVASETYRDGMHAQARRVGEVKAERDAYRDKLGRAIDAAHEVVRVMEVER